MSTSTTIQQNPSWEADGKKETLVQKSATFLNEIVANLEKGKIDIPFSSVVEDQTILLTTTEEKKEDESQRS